MKYSFLNDIGRKVYSSEVQDEELLLANARFALAIFSLAAVNLEPSHLDRRIVNTIFLAYILHSLLVLVLLRIHLQSTHSFRVMVHAVDTLWAALICCVAGTLSGGLLFVVFLFPLLAAAYRWGLLGSTVTAGVSFLLLGTATALGRRWQFPWLRSAPQHLVIQAACLLMMAYLVGYLAEKERQLRLKSSVTSQIVGKAYSQTSLRVTLEVLFDAFLKLFDSNRAVLALQHTPDEKSFLWEAQLRSDEGRTAVRLSELDSFQRARYFFPIPGQGWFAIPKGAEHFDGRFRMLLLGADGLRMQSASYHFPDYFLTWHPFRSLLGVAFDLGQDQEWSGRLFVFDPRPHGDREAHLRFLQELVRAVAPAVYSVYRLRRVRSRAGAMERTRIARELHDGVIQTLIGVEMKLDGLGKRFAGDPGSALEELGRIRRLLRNETLNVRELIQQIKPLGSGPRELLEFIGDLVERFRRETGISVQFVSAFNEVTVSAMLARELARIVQEALVNIRKHSGASHALIHLGSQRGMWKLVIEDDGRGFDFSGRLSMAELEMIHQGPMVLKERVRGIGGDLAIESTPGRGARLEILLPNDAYA
jgi:signal transduction histidine kinase